MARPKRRTIGDRPLDAVNSRPRAAESEREPHRPAKVRSTFHLPQTVIERIKNAVYWTPGLTLADLAAQALTDAVDRMEKKRGEPFPPRRANLRGGRPIK